MGLNYFREGDYIEIVIRDPTGAKIEKHVCSINDKKKYAKILDYLKEKYGFEPEINIKESVNALEDDLKEPEKLDWWG